VVEAEVEVDLVPASVLVEAAVEEEDEVGVEVVTGASLVAFVVVVLSLVASQLCHEF